MSKVVDDSHAKYDGGEENLSSSSEAFRLPEEASPSTEGVRRRRHGTPPHAQKEWYSKTEAARYLGVAEITITRYLERGILQAHRLPTPGREAKQSNYDYGRLRIHKSDLDRYLESVDRHPDDAQASQALGTPKESSTEVNSVSTATIGNVRDWKQELARLVKARDAARDAAKASKRPRRNKRNMTKEEEEAELREAELREYFDPLQQAKLILTREEAALLLGVSWRTINRYIKSGVLRLAGYFRCPDSYTRAHVYRSDVEKLLQSDDSSHLSQD